MKTKTSITRALDKVASEIVRKRGRCERCSKKETLQCCHIYSRTYRNLRWDLDNLLCLCAGCHFYFHKNPIEFTRFIEQKLGKEKVEQLNEIRNSYIKYTLQDLELKLKVLKEMNVSKSPVY